MAIKTIPSLVIGLGGTGKRALTHLKRRIFDTYGREDLPWIRLLSIDTDSAGVNNPPVISQRTGEYINLGSEELRVIDQSDTPQVISNLDAPENRHIKDWYPDPEMKVDFPKAARGSGQVRMFGRIGLYKGDNLHTTYRWLQQAAHDVSDPASWEDFPGFEVDQTLQFVYVICSLCGGTGSGMFLDVAYMLRKIVGVDPSTRRFVGMFVMPEVYEPVVENQHIKRIYANAYGALREMDYLLNSPKRSYTIRGKDHTFVDFQNDVTPFDFVFMFSNKNKKGAVISQRQVSGDKPVATDDRVSQFMSETIMTDVLSPVTERSESILSNIFSSLGDPEQVEDRTFHKVYSAVGVSSVKVPSISYYQDMLEMRITDSVVNFLLRPDPDVTEKTLAKEFWMENMTLAEEQLTLKTSLSNDASYGRFMSKPFLEEFRTNRPACIDRLKQWVESVMNPKVDFDRHLDVERPAVNASKEVVDKITKALDASLKSYTKDPEKGYAFLCEWLEELIFLVDREVAQLPSMPTLEGDPRRYVKEAIESLQRVSNDVQLPVLRDTIEVLLERLAEFYDGRGRDERTQNLIVGLYGHIKKVIEAQHVKLRSMRDGITKLDRQIDQEYCARVATMSDTSQERILIDKSLIGRKEIESFLNSLLAPLWQDGNWKAIVPELSYEIKAQIEQELSPKLIEITFDPSLSQDDRVEKLDKTIRKYVNDKLLSRVVVTDPQTGRPKEPSYTTDDGKSLLLDFSKDNLLSLMISHSTPMWHVQTHQIGSASQPITFVGLNGIKIPEEVMDELKRQLPTFRPTDVVLSDTEPRVLVKQYDPLYSLASLSCMIDYENYYKNTDRRQNPMHTDVKFMAEPNPYTQWLTYRVPERLQVKTCPKGHDIAEALKDNSRFCPTCSDAGVKTLIVAGKILCPLCQEIIDKGSRKCPECSGIIDGKEDRAIENPQAPGAEKKSLQCPGCVTLGKEDPETVVVKRGKDGPGRSYCPTCGSAWANLCPYCGTVLEKSTVCTKGSDRCIFESPPIVLCLGCDCPVTPDTTKCPRCFLELVECEKCRTLGKPRRMNPKGTEKCASQHSEPVAVSAT